jgi:hypothetical protein
LPPPLHTNDCEDGPSVNLDGFLERVWAEGAIMDKTNSALGTELGGRPRRYRVWLIDELDISSDNIMIFSTQPNLNNGLFMNNNG